VGSLLEVGTGFHAELTGRENIYLNGAILGMRRREIQRKFDEIVDFAGVAQFIDTPVKHYSSGMYMRLAFAVAAHMETEILLVDEVLAVGDLTFQRKCIGEIGRSVKSGRTVVIVSHQLSLIASMCPTTIWLNHGNLSYFGRTQDAFDAYDQHNRATGGSGVQPIVREADTHDARRPVISSVQIMDDDAVVRHVFENGEYLTICVVVRGALPSAAYFEWQLLNEKHEVATSGGTFMSPTGIELPAGTEQIRARVGPLPLAQGTYWLGTRLGVQPGFIIDEWSDATTIVISKCIPESIGLPFDSRRGVVFVPCEYVVNGVNAS
jgi:lipopolysaccharide transport system ATP-binding protein